MHNKYALSGWNMFRACMDREVLLVKRNLFLCAPPAWLWPCLSLCGAFCHRFVRVHELQLQPWLQLWSCARVSCTFTAMRLATCCGDKSDQQSLAECTSSG